MLTEDASGPKAQREKMAELIFDQFAMPRLYIAMQSRLALFCTGRNNGLVIDSGAGITHYTPIYDGYAYPHGCRVSDVAGNRVSLMMQSKVFQARDYTKRERHVITEHIKANHCFIAQKKTDTHVWVPQTSWCANADTLRELAANHKQHLGSHTLLNMLPSEIRTEVYRFLLAQPTETRVSTPCTYESLAQPYVLPDGHAITLDNVCFNAPEHLFAPDINEYLSFPGMHALAFDSIMKCDTDIRAELASNIMLVGGGTKIPGTFSLRSLLPEPLASRVHVYAHPRREILTWMGGSMLTSLPTFKDMWCTKEEFDEVGPQIVHRKCSFV